MDANNIAYPHFSQSLEYKIYHICDYVLDFWPQSADNF